MQGLKQVGDREEKLQAWCEVSFHRITLQFK